MDMVVRMEETAVRMKEMEVNSDETAMRMKKTVVGVEDMWRRW